MSIYMLNVYVVQVKCTKFNVYVKVALSFQTINISPKNIFWVVSIHML